MSASPKPKPAPPQPTQNKVGGIGVLASPKFSFRAALGQHKASKLASKTAAETTETVRIFGAASQDSKISRPARAGNASSIPSLSGRGRFNSTSSDIASTSTLPKRRGANASPDASRTLSSLGKRQIDGEMQALGTSSSSISDFGALIRPKAGAAQSASLSGLSSRSATNNSKLPGPPSARTLWSSASTKGLASPVTSKAPRKIARSDSVAEVHAATRKTPPSVPSAGARATTASASGKAIQRPKIGTLPKPKPKLRPRRMLLDEKPLLGFKQRAETEDQDGSESDEEDEDGLEGPDISRIRTKKAADTTAKVAAPPTGSRIPSAGSTRIATRSGQRASINGTWPGVAASEKENIAQLSATQGKASQRLSAGIAARARSSLPLAVTQPTPQDNLVDQVTDVHVTETAPATAQQIHPDPNAIPSSPSKMSSLSALRTRGESAKSSKILPPATHRPNLGIKTSIIQANPIHPSILSIQSKHQPISTPEALIKAKKRLSGALLSSSSSSSTTGTSSTERASTLPRSMSTSTPRSPIKSSLLLPFPKDTEAKDKEKSAKPHPQVPSPKPGASSISAARTRVMSSSEIDANLLASLKVVAQKAKINVRDLLEEDGAYKEGVTRGRGREASQELLDELAGDVSVDLMALDLAGTGSPAASEGSMLRSPVGFGLGLDTPECVLAGKARPETTVDVDAKETGEGMVKGEVEEEEDEGDASCPSPSLRAVAARTAPVPQRIIPPSSSASAFREPQQYDELETPVRHSYRNAASPTSTPFPASASPTKKYPPSAAMSARTRSRLKKALRESLALEAHFAAVNIYPNSNGNGNGSGEGERMVQKRDGNMEKEGALERNVSAMLLTEDDGFLDELVSAVARIGLENAAAPEAKSGDSSIDTPTQPQDVVDKMTPQLSLSPSPAATSEGKNELVEKLETQLAASAAHAASLEQQLTLALQTSSRMDKTQTVLGEELARLRGELAGAEWGKAREGWGRARVEALTETEDLKGEADALLVFKAQMRLWEGLVRAM